MSYRSDRNQSMTRRWLQRAWGDLCSTSDAGVIPAYRQGLVQLRGGCSTPLLYCGLHWCLLDLRSSMRHSVRRGPYSQSPEFSVQWSLGRLKQTLPASFGITLHLCSASASVVWHIRTIFPETWFPEEGNVGAWAGRELPCTPAGTLLCSAGLRCKRGWRLPSSKAQTSSIIGALSEFTMQFSEPCMLANLGLHFLRIPKGM